MTRYRPTTRQRTARVKRRTKARDEAAATLELLREWHTSRQQSAAKRAAVAEKAHRKNTDRGIYRVPEHLLGLHQEIEPYKVSKHGNPIDSTPAPRRPGGSRRTPRRRDLPGAVARRVARHEATR